MDDLHADDRVSLDQLQEQYQLRHGVGVAFLKQQVGPGDEYRNSAARAVISPNGAWFEFLDLPMEFTGLAGAPVSYRFVTDAEAVTVADRLYGLCRSASPANTRLISLFVLYTRRGILDGRGVFAYQLQGTASKEAPHPVEIGRFRPGELPLAFRCRLETDMEAPVKSGALFCLTGVGEANLLVELSYDGEAMHDLAVPPINAAPQ